MTLVQFQGGKPEAFFLCFIDQNLLQPAPVFWRRRGANGQPGGTAWPIQMRQ
ncbi:hypothetical protein [Solimonas sp. SE-A11]|uniref:hypothetical protein n=1 Tax=Solimonas sp. SE-A11 TaxID=3054954 RepID=UPI00259D2874|nr:hypothetical protein [Solimonas sp. SE-A11]MDM4772536.1 hypothetical protein [Solimonas sp. SE-A11]